MKKGRKLLMLLGMTVLAVGLLTACNSVQTAAPVPEATETPSGAAADEVILGFDHWKEIYPDIYQSMAISELHADGSQHFNMGEYMSETFKGPNYEAKCIACKSTDFNTVYPEVGDEVFKMTYGELVEKMGNKMSGEFWNCYYCHGNDPENTLKPTNMYWNTVLSKANYDFAEKDLTCGQCHNGVGFSRYIANSMEEVADLKVYENGISVDALLQKIKDGNLTNFYDAPNEAGTYRWWTIGGLMEQFQDSKHQNLGLSCNDCHMNTVTRADGTTYTSHNAAGSVLESKEKLESCLGCHQSSGIKTVDEMRTFVTGKVAEKDTKVQVVAAKLKNLYELILAGVKNGDVDENTLQQARDIYANADTYYQYADGGSVSHDYAEILEVLQKADTTVESGIALFK